MEKIKNFFNLWFGINFWGFVILLLAVAVPSFLVQSLLIGVGRLFSSDANTAVVIDALLGFILIAPVYFCAGHSEHKGDGNILVGLLAIMGIYISVVWYFHGGILFGCIVLLYSCLARLRKIRLDSLRIYGGTCVYLLYCIGAYFAMIFNDLEPAINIYGIVTLIVATIGVWLIPATE